MLCSSLDVFVRFEVLTAHITTVCITITLLGEWFISIFGGLEDAVRKVLFLSIALQWL